MSASKWESDKNATLVIGHIQLLMVVLSPSGTRRDKFPHGS